MNFLKRCLRSLWYNRKNGLLLFLIFTVAFSLVLAGLMLLQSARESSRTLRREYQASVGIYDFATRSYDVHDQNLLSQETVEALAAHPLVAACYPFYYSTVRGGDPLRPWVQEEQAQAYGENSSLRVIGTAQAEAAPEFATGNHFLLEGDLLTPEDTLRFMVSEDLAELNGLQLGDQVELFAYYLASGGENVTATLTGIYGIGEYLPHTQAPYFNSENLLYVTPDVAQLLNGPQSGAYSVTCVIADPEQASHFVEEVEGMGLPEGDDLRFVIDDGQYRAVKNAIQASTRIAWAALISSIAVGGTVLILLTLLQLRSRDHEIGVLLALGEGRGKIYAQLLGESLVPILLAMAGAVALSPLTSQGVSWLFQGSLTQPPQVSAPAVLALFLSGLALTLCASLVTAHKLLAYQPKTILMAEG